MGVYRFEDRIPVIGEGSFVFPTASVVGDVEIGEGVYIGPGAVVRGDYGSVVIGDRTSVEENVVIHARPGERTVIHDDVTLGHGCVIHNCEIHDLAVVGMGAVVSDYVIVGRWGVIAEGAVVKSRTAVEPEIIMVGVPAVPKAKVSDAYKELWLGFKAIYPDLADRYPKGLERLD